MDRNEPSWIVADIIMGNGGSGAEDGAPDDEKGGFPTILKWDHGDGTNMGVFLVAELHY